MGGGQTYCETNADGSSEGPREELALVVLNQEGGFAHSAVTNQDALQRRRGRGGDSMNPCWPLPGGRVTWPLFKL